MRSRRGILHDILRDNTKIEGRVSGHVDQRRGGTVADNELVAGYVCEIRGNLLDRGRNAPTGYDLQFGSTHCNPP